MILKDYMRTVKPPMNDARLCERCKMREHMTSSPICSQCHADVMCWVFLRGVPDIAEFRNLGKGG
jgi:hypothetical protein